MFNLAIGKLTNAKKSLAWISALGFAAFAQTAAAVPFPNPLPALLLEDIDGDGYYQAGGIGEVALEIFDAAEGASEFGFYEQGNAGTLISIFDTADAVGNAAIINFAAGFVFDFELAAAQSLFTTPTNPIGFYLKLPNLTLYSDPTLNPAGLDFLAAHPAIAGTSFDLLFRSAGTQAVGPVLFSWHRITGITGVPVPTPSSIALMMLGLAVMGRRKLLK